MGYSAKAVANYFLENYPDAAIVPLKVNKLVYISHGWNYAFERGPLVDNEFVIALPHSPAYISLLMEFRYRGGLPIINLATELDLDSTMSKGKVITYEPKIAESDTSITDFLDEMWRIYGNHSVDQLARLCDAPDSPWQDVRDEYPNMINPHIPNDSIENYYKKLYKQHSELEK